MIAKVHKTRDGKKIVAICDSNLIGKKFEEKGIQLDLSSTFYKGEEKTKDEIKKLLNGAYVANMVGEEAVALGIERGVVVKDRVISVRNVPHAQTIMW